MSVQYTVLRVSVHRDPGATAERIASGSEWDAALDDVAQAQLRYVSLPTCG